MYIRGIWGEKLPSKSDRMMFWSYQFPFNSAYFNKIICWNYWSPRFLLCFSEPGGCLRDFDLLSSLKFPTLFFSKDSAAMCLIVWMVWEWPVCWVLSWGWVHCRISYTGGFWNCLILPDFEEPFSVVVKRKEPIASEVQILTLIIWLLALGNFSSFVLWSAFH